MYKIIHVDKSWIVCEEQAKLIIFDRKSVALQAVHDAEDLLRASEEKARVNSAIKGKANDQLHPIGSGKYIVLSQ